MRTTLNIEDNLIKKVSKLTGIKEKTTMVKLGLEALIAMESSKRLAKLGGTEKDTSPEDSREIKWFLLIPPYGCPTYVSGMWALRNY